MDEEEIGRKLKSDIVVKRMEFSKVPMAERNQKKIQREREREKFREREKKK